MERIVIYVNYHKNEMNYKAMVNPALLMLRFYSFQKKLDSY